MRGKAGACRGRYTAATVDPHHLQPCRTLLLVYHGSTLHSWTPTPGLAAPLPSYLVRIERCVPTYQAMAMLYATHDPPPRGSEGWQCRAGTLTGLAAVASCSCCVLLLVAARLARTHLVRVASIESTPQTSMRGARKLRLWERRRSQSASVPSPRTCQNTEPGCRACKQRVHTATQLE